MTAVTCHTRGCPKEGEVVEADLTYWNPDTNTVETVDAVYCGACGNEITDLADPPDLPDNALPPEPVDRPDRVDNTLPEPDPS